MTTNGVPYEEYKGFYLARGITMPSQGVFEWNVYSSAGAVAFEEPLHTFSSREEAIRWVDENTIQLGDRMVEIKLGEQPSRPFPQTYRDWVDLAEDIKARYVDDPVGKASVNYRLRHIGEGTEEADEAKRWLVEKARQLGIS